MESPSLKTSIRTLTGVGEARARAFGRMGITDLGGLVSFFPRAYEDRTVFKPIAMLMEGESVCVRGTVATEPVLSRVRGRLELVKFKVVDDSGVLDVTYFNQSYIKDQLRRGEDYVFYGRVGVQGARRQMTNPVFERESAAGGVTGRIMPIYRLVSGLSQRAVMGCVRQALDLLSGSVPDALPESVSRRFQLCQARYAYENVHFPADFASLELARRRLVFEELFVLACALSMLRGRRGAENGIRLKPADLRQFYYSLPFTPTGAQLRAVDEAVADMCSGRPMDRLIQGDVGSGKTLAAAACVWYAAQSGCQSAFMAPTEVLAGQHLETLRGFLSPFGLDVRKLTGSMPARERRETLSALKSGECSLCVGTHALLSEGVEFKDLALVVTDEQHRFGVAQRAALASKGSSPHILVMSATPIPRTLALMIYGDLDVSLIDELPPGRQKVDTFAVGSSYRPRINKFIRRLVGEGRQVYVVCPKIEEDESDEAASGLMSAEEHARELRREFPDLTVGCVHGRLKPREKDAAMASFAAGETDILVSTTVIEVGVDVPNAALMIVENAERFGLSQLHQLRGRVGRGRHKSYCILISDSRSEETRERLAAMTHTNDGFKIAEEDLRLRGPGDFFGSRQHGLPELHVADLGADMSVLSTAQSAAADILRADPGLELPEHAALRSRAFELIDAAGGRFN